MTITSEYIQVKENDKFLRKEVLTSKVSENSFLKMEICKDKDSDNYDSYQFTNQSGDIFIFKAEEFTSLLMYFNSGKDINMSEYNKNLMSPKLIKEFKPQ